VSTRRTLAPLALLLPPTLTLLSIVVVDMSEDGVDNIDTKAVIDQLLALQQLQQLQVQVSLHTRFGCGAEIVGLSCLTQLQLLQLKLMPVWQVTLCDTQLFALLQPLRQLRTLSHIVSSDFLSHTSLRVIGEASWQLRHLTLWTGPVFYFAPAFDTARDNVILFPHLRFLSVSSPASENIRR
jgi:hypothetical protein